MIKTYNEKYISIHFYQMNKAISIAIKVFKKNHRVSINIYPPIKTFLFSEDIFNTGIEEINLNGIKIRIYNPEKTLIDCFRYRNKIGSDVFLESLKMYFKKYNPNYLKLMEYAKICKFEKTIKPYLEMII